MIDLDLPPEIELLQQTAREFARDRLVPRDREFEAARAPAPDVRRLYREIGLHAVELPESLGGADLGALARAVVLEELGAADAGAALALDPLGPALYPIREVAGPQALEQIAGPWLAAADAQVVLVAEPGLAPTGAGAPARLSGQVPWIPADAVDALVGLSTGSAWIAEEGFSLERVPGAGLRAAGASAVRLVDVPVRLLGSDAAAVARARARARLYYASLLVGVLRAAAERSREYAQERVAFGRPIAHHQALAFLITDMHVAVESARLLVHEAAWHADRGLPFEARAAAASVEAVEAQALVGPSGVQILGGHGFMQDYPLEKYMRESRALGLMLGGVDAAREEAGHAVCAATAPLDLTGTPAL